MTAKLSGYAPAAATTPLRNRATKAFTTKDTKVHEVRNFAFVCLSVLPVCRSGFAGSQRNFRVRLIKTYYAHTLYKPTKAFTTQDTKFHEIKSFDLRVR